MKKRPIVQNKKANEFQRKPKGHKSHKKCQKMLKKCQQMPKIPKRWKGGGGCWKKSERSTPSFKKNFPNNVLAICFFLMIISKTCFIFNDVLFLHKHKKMRATSPLPVIY